MCGSAAWLPLPRMVILNSFDDAITGPALIANLPIDLQGALVPLGPDFGTCNSIGEMDPNITPTMPVLRSPLLSLHVSVIMLAYALLSISFLCSVTALIVRRQALQSLMLLSQLMLYPAIATLAIGIFIGAVWANVSWGSYWSWDPKEVWALITLMVYAVPMHRGTVKAMARPTVYHIYMVGAFGVLLMTYFGVNYLMTGMHSYY